MSEFSRTTPSQCTVFTEILFDRTRYHFHLYTFVTVNDANSYLRTPINAPGSSIFAVPRTIHITHIGAYSTLPAAASINWFFQYNIDDSFVYGKNILEVATNQAGSLWDGDYALHTRSDAIRNSNGLIGFTQNNDIGAGGVLYLSVSGYWDEPPEATLIQPQPVSLEGYKWPLTKRRV